MTRKQLILMLCVLVLPVAAGAQTITQRLQQRVAGQGVVNIYQNDSVRRVVDGNPVVKPAAAKADKASARQGADQKAARPAEKDTTKPAAKDATKPTAKDSGRREHQDERHNAQQPTPEEQLVPNDSLPQLNRNVLRGGRKMKGFRVQAYAGGNSRRDHSQAERVKDKVKEALPDEPVYVHFNSPRWTCRVGNYRTYAEAQAVLQQIRQLGIEGANIVKTQITVKDDE